VTRRCCRASQISGNTEAQRWIKVESRTVWKQLNRYINANEKASRSSTGTLGGRGAAGAIVAPESTIWKFRWKSMS
jgi:hypothetical protein